MLLVSTSSLSGYGLHKIFSLVKQSSYDGIDLVVDPENYDTFDAKYIRLLSEYSGVKVWSISAPERKMNKKQVDTILRLAEDLGVTLVNFHPPHRIDRDKEWFGEYLELMTKNHPEITISIVNAPPKTWLFIISEYGDARPETIKKITGNTTLSINNVEPESWVDLLKTFSILGNTIKHIYLTDKTEEHSRMFLGSGSMPLESLLIKLSELGYRGSFSLEVTPHELHAGNDDEVLRRLSEAKHFWEKYYTLPKR